ncbi:MAG: aspartate/glutamate racemase family protein [Verrucomicrobiae bacterium]|nr:aspartate/glutamate racemase family protein [Verrucomicrobiae bacterium]
MKPKVLGLVHTSAMLVPMFQQLCRDKLPGVEAFNIADDSLIKDVIRHGGLTPGIARRLLQHIFLAEDAGADYIMVTCSSVGPAVETASSLCQVPVLRIDQPMADKAVQLGTRIGVIATLSTTLEPTADLIRRRAAIAHKHVQLEPHLCEGAFDALVRGDAARHDAMIRDALVRLGQRADVIVLAQASMARVAEALDPRTVNVPILASPSIAFEYLAGALQRL